MSVDTNSWSRKIALVLIICAVVGTEVSYHFTLESRFEAIEEKLQQQTVAMQQMQDSLDSSESSKAQTLTGLNKQLASLQSSFEPLGKTTQAQADALDQLHQQLSILQQSQSDSQDAQKKLSAYMDQLQTGVKKARADAAAAAAAKSVVTPVSTAAPLPVPTTNAATSTPPSVPLPPSVPMTNATGDLMASPGAVSHPVDHSASDSIAAETNPAPTAPRAIAALDLRPVDTHNSPRALPVGSSIAR